MAWSCTITHSLPVHIPRCKSLFAIPRFIGLVQNVRHQNVVELRARGKKNNDLTLASDEPPKRAPRKTRKKKTAQTLGDEDEIVPEIVSKEENTNDGSEKPRRTRKKAVTSTSGEIKKKKAVRRKKAQEKTQESEAEDGDLEWPVFAQNAEDIKEDDLDFTEDREEEDISFTYGWPPLVCCFGAAQHCFIPSGRPANRLIDHEIHRRRKDELWSPSKFVRAPGSSSGSVALALATLGGKVAFMGKLGNDYYGQTMLYYLNVNNVQTRSISVDTDKRTAISHMKIVGRDRLRATCVKQCAEDSLVRSEINIGVLKEAKMFYFNSLSLLERDMRSVTLQAVKISKKLGGVIFFDLNLPMPLWHSSNETKMFIQEAWSLADIVEVTKQELEFLCDIQPSEEFDTEDNDKSKFIHYKKEAIMPLWHDNLKVLFVTNGTSKIHYYTEKHNGSVHGMEDAPITPFTCDMSASGDGIVAALMRMLSVQPQLITDKTYLEQTIKYAIDCGVIDQWILGRTRGFPPKEDAEEEMLSDQNGIRSITEKEFRTLTPVS